MESSPSHEEALEHLQSERERLEEIKDHFAEEHLSDESAGVSVEALTVVSQHPADLGTETFDRERDMSILEQVEGELADVEHALRRLDAGTYGTCEACGKPIGDVRLEARPEARLCLEDQEVAEREARLRATHS
ncbi:MAG TPA: TraR/DksA C4-type zinc finger protein [Acidimicrobiales bacterium]|nr:TraR/DksA C4-type zinc finger protein [Acidimicrobiales bacterium]